MSFPFDALRRHPDIDAADLQASDAADRLLLDESAAARSGDDGTGLVVIGDAYGALTLASAADGARGIRVHQDLVTGERALAENARRLGIDAAGFASLPLGAELVRDARVVLLRLPRSLDALRDAAGCIAAHADPDVVVFAGGRVKHMTTAMNEVLGGYFARVDVTHARQKSRVLIARGPHDGADPHPRRAVHDGIAVCAFGGAFAGTSIDIGTRLLLQHLPPLSGAVVDLACGTGVVATTLALRHPDLRIRATDASEIAVRSARATTEANRVGDRVEVVRDDVLSTVSDAAVDAIALNPPFHSGAAVSATLAERFFRDAARALRPGGELWTVWNSGLRYRGALERLVGPTRQVARNAKFTVTASTRR